MRSMFDLFDRNASSPHRSHRPRHPRRLGASAGLLGVVLVAAACGGTSAGTGSGAAGGTGSESAGSPIEQLFGNASASQRALEDQVAACMRERGWQYTPNTAMFEQGEIAGDPTSDPAFVEQYGYGISTQPPPDAFGATVIDADKDPNSAYLQGLSAEDQQRYFDDLWGGQISANGGDATGAVAVSAEIDPNSCQSKASAAIAEDHPEMSDAFSKRFGELAEAMEQDPKMAAATEKWSDCMAKADFTYAGVDEVYEDLQRRVSELYPSEGAPIGPDQNAASGAAATLPAADQERLDKLQRDERAIAKADRACRIDTIDKVRPQLEQELVEKLRSEFPGIGGGK